MRTAGSSDPVSRPMRLFSTPLLPYQITKPRTTSIEGIVNERPERVSTALRPGNEYEEKNAASGMAAAIDTAADRRDSQSVNASSRYVYGSEKTSMMASPPSVNA